MWKPLRAVFNLPGFRTLYASPLFLYLRKESKRRLPDRRFMEALILPTIVKLRPKRVLFVGTEYFTRHYSKWFEPAGIEYWTLDLRPEVAVFGSKDRHVIADVLEADRHFEPNYFDVVLMNGVLGHGVNTIEASDCAIRALYNVLRQDGLLLLGWNRGTIPDPLGLSALNDQFVHAESAPLSRRVEIPYSEHVYDVFYAR